MDLLRTLLFLPPGGSSFADGIDGLHAFVITVTMLASTFVFAAAIWFTIRYRKRGAGPAITERVAPNAPRETLLIGGILGTFLLWWVIGFAQYVEMQEPPEDATVVYVTAKQWMWKFEYPEGASTNDVLVVPAGRKVKLVMTSRDVIHSFFVPAFRLKQDVLPGRYTTLWFEAAPGTYPLFCAEYCGVSHSRMLGQVRVLPENEYADWLRSATRGDALASPLAARGAEIAARRGCLACHTLDGQPHVGPTWSRLYMKTVTLEDGRTLVADDAYLTRSMMEPQADVVAGFRPVMPTYFGQLTPTETAAILELLHALAGGSIPTGISLPRLQIAPGDGGLPDAAPLGPEPDGGGP